MKFTKYHAIGNDYIVLDPREVGEAISRAQVRRICDRHYGVGSDGILLGPLPSRDCDFGVRLFNPDGGEFEKSGNGLRILARYLWDTGRVQHEAFTVSTPGGQARCRVHANGKMVTVELGRVSFQAREIPVLGYEGEVLNETFTIGGEALRFCAATTGNPHCILIRDEICEAETRRWGPLIEKERRFPKGTNVQFMKVMDPGNIRIEIWERGAGYTLASGSSSCAAAAAAHRLGYCGPEVTVHMPGGRLEVSIDDQFAATLTGPVARICEGRLLEG